MKSPTYKLTPGHERYRECKECKKPFMADHLSMEFCPGTKCKQEYNNRIHREKSKLMLKVETVEKSELAIHNERLVSNIALFDSLQIPPDGRIYEFENLVNAGIYFEAFSEKVRNLDSILNYSYYYGDYLICRKNETQVFIVKTQEK